MDCLSGGDLRSYLRRHGPLDELSVIYLLASLSSALSHIHHQGVIHRDIKPENIALDSLSRPYLTDFGISLISTTDNPLPLSNSSSGTLPYLAPEVLSAATGNYHSYQADYWSLGIVGFELLFDSRPFPRHCPLEWIQYSANECHGWIWNELLERAKGVETVGAHEDDQEGDQVVQHRHQHTPDTPLTSFVNFDSIPRPEGWKKPYPNFVSEMDSREEKDEEYRVNFPDHVLTLSGEMKRLLCGLMDLRVSRRLGNLSRSLELISHDCFTKLDGLTAHEFPALPSPLMRGSDLSSGLLSGALPRPLRKLIPTAEGVGATERVGGTREDELALSLLSQLDPHLRKELMEFHFVKPAPCPPSPSAPSGAPPPLPLKLQSSTADPECGGGTNQTRSVPNTSRSTSRSAYRY